MTLFVLASSLMDLHSLATSVKNSCSLSSKFLFFSFVLFGVLEVWKF